MKNRIFDWVYTAAVYLGMSALAIIATIVATFVLSDWVPYSRITQTIGATLVGFIVLFGLISISNSLTR